MNPKTPIKKGIPISDDIILYLSDDYKIIEASPSALEFYDCTPKDLVGRNVFETCLEHNWEVPFPQALTKNKQSSCEWTTINLPKSSNPTPTMIVVGKKKDRASRIDKHQVFLENIILNVPEIIFWKDTNSVYLGCNQNYARLVGLASTQEIVGKTDMDLPWRADGNTAEFFRQRDQESIKEGKVVTIEQVLSLPSGTKINILMNKAPLINEYGESIGVLGVGTDITHQKNIEHHLLEAKKLADVANLAKSQFIANISHDLRTPLNSIMGFSQILAMRINDEENRSFVGHILESSKLLLGLIENIIDFTKHSNSEFTPSQQPFNFNQTISSLLMIISPQMETKGLQLIEHLDEQMPEEVLGDINCIKRVATNLLGNAIKFTQHGSITVSTHFLKDKSAIDLRIEDTGIGIPEDKLSCIFDRFTKLEPSYKNDTQSSGLGLAIVKQIIEQLGGEIFVESVFGKGTVMTCRVPVGML